MHVVLIITIFEKICIGYLAVKRSVRIGKYFPRSQKRSVAEGRGSFLRPRETFPYTDRPNRQIIGLFFF